MCELRVTQNKNDLTDSKKIFPVKQLSRGIFWIVSGNYDLSDWTFIMFKIPCEPCGNSSGDLPLGMNSKNGLTYNHKKTWAESVRNNNVFFPYNKKEYDWYPRGRVEISNNKAVVFTNPNIGGNEFIDKIKSEFGLSSCNITDVNVIMDGSSHYKCYLDK